MGTEGQANAARGGGGTAVAQGHDERVRARRDRAGRLGYIGFAVKTQRELGSISKGIRDANFDLVENHQVKLNSDQLGKLVAAREAVLNAADMLHSVATELLGEPPREA
jgi:hypothetical protein